MTLTETFMIEIASQERKYVETRSRARWTRAAPSSFEPGVDPAILAVEAVMTSDCVEPGENTSRRAH